MLMKPLAMLQLSCVVLRVICCGVLLQATPIQLFGFLLGIIGTVVYANGSSRWLPLNSLLANGRSPIA